MNSESLSIMINEYFGSSTRLTHRRSFTSLGSGERRSQAGDIRERVSGVLKMTMSSKDYSNVGRLFCTPAPPKFTKKLAVDSFFNFGS